MKALNPDEISEIGNGRPLELFRSGIQSDETLRSYRSLLKRVLCTALKNVLQGTYEERVEELVKMAKEDPSRARRIFTSLVNVWIEQTKLEPSDAEYMALGSIRTSLTPVQKLLEMNEAPLPWKVILRMCPRKKSSRPKPGWTSEEIREMLSSTTSSMMRAVILIMASSGVRRGGIELKWGDIDPVYLKDGKPVTGEDAPEMLGTAEPECAMMRVYPDDPEEYTTFMVPEAYKALMKYKAEWEKEVGRPPKPKDPVFKKKGCEPIPLTHVLINNRLWVIVKKAGIQKRSRHNGKLYKVPVSNGFRRRFNKIMTNTPTDDALGADRRKEYMLGHYGSVGLDHVYYHARNMELAAHYLRAVPALTVTSEGLRLIERESWIKKMHMFERELKIMRQEEETHADAGMLATQNREVIDSMEKTVKQCMKRLDSLGKGL